MPTIAALLRAHEVLFIFVWGAVKALLPFPSPSLMMLTGALFVPPGTGLLKAAAIVLARIGVPGAAGTTAGSWVYYELARAKGQPFAERWAPAVGLRRAMIVRFERLSGQNKTLLAFILFAVPLVPLILAAVASGIAGASRRRFAAGAFAGSVARCFLLGWAGHVTRRTYAELAGGLPTPALLAAAAMIGAAALLLSRRTRARQAAPAAPRDPRPR